MSKIGMAVCVVGVILNLVDQNWLAAIWAAAAFMFAWSSASKDQS